jgi:S-adenosyl-L-methionine hydrolase (adenosine-forming)
LGTFENASYTSGKTEISEMPVITLTTDWGTTDYALAALKGDILTELPGATIVDISHNVTKFDLVNGAFIFRNAWKHFPSGTVHVIGFTGTQKSEPGVIAVRKENHFFLGSNDGFFSLIFDDKPQEIYYVLSADGKKVRPDSRILGNAAAFLAKGGSIKDMGREVDDFQEKSGLIPVIEEKVIRGTIIYINNFGNIVTNISREIFERVSKGRKFEILVRKNEYRINRISDSYSDVDSGMVVALYDPEGYLEIAIAHGNASDLLGLAINDTVRIEFK